MQNINKVTYYLNSQFDGVYTILDDILFVNLDFLTNRNYQFEGVNEFLFTVSDLGRDKIVAFLIRDGANPYLTSMKLLIEKTIEIHNLDTNTCFIIGYYDLGIEKATTIYCCAADVWTYQIYECIKELPLSSNSFNLKFAALFGRHDPFRLKICRYLYENFKDDSLLSYNSFNISYNHRFAEYFNDDKVWAETHCPILLDFDHAAGWVPFQDSLATIQKHYQNYFIEIVVETDPHTNNFFTEKTLKNLYLGKPFLLLSGPGSLRYLRSLGFRTFGDVLDESYDNEPGIADRLNAIFAEIERLSQYTLDELGELYNQLLPIFEHNRKLFETKGTNLVEQKIINSA
jgi:hypothetical protein